MRGSSRNKTCIVKRTYPWLLHRMDKKWIKTKKRKFKTFKKIIKDLYNGKKAEKLKIIKTDILKIVSFELFDKIYPLNFKLSNLCVYVCPLRPRKLWTEY